MEVQIVDNMPDDNCNGLLELEPRHSRTRNLGLTASTSADGAIVAMLYMMSVFRGHDVRRLYSIAYEKNPRSKEKTSP